MSPDSSSSINSSLPPQQLHSSNSSLALNMYGCLKYRSVFLIFVSFCGTNILLLLPLCVLVLYLGVRRWRRHSAAASHSDVFTYHMVAMEMIGIVGGGLYCSAMSVGVPMLMLVGVYIVSGTTGAQVPFHILTCVERYLAIVHPFTYLKLRERGGVRIRNVSIGCVWLYFLGSFGISIGGSTIPFFCVSIFAIAVISFCSLSVVHALIRPGPGEVGGDRQRVDQSKMRALHIITAIMGALLFRFVGQLLVLSFYHSSAVSQRVRCDALTLGVWFGLPTSLVLPLLFLHRLGKLLCCKTSNQSGQGSQ